MILSNENYFSKEADMHYLSVSQYKDFAGSVGKRGCEARAMAKLKGEWKTEMTDALLVGSYVDAHFEGTQDLFKAQHPEIFKKDGSLLAKYVKADEIIQRVERDELFMQAMSGKKQVIMTANNLFGFGDNWKIKIDSLLDNCIVDLKCMASITKMEWVKDIGKINFVEYWGYDIQAAIYQKVVQVNTGKRLPFYIAACTKEKTTNLELIAIDNKHLDDVLYSVSNNIPRILRLKAGELQPDRCCNCDYCLETKVLKEPIHFRDIQEVV